MEHEQPAPAYNEGPVPMQNQVPVVLGMTGAQLQELIAGIVGNLPAPAPALAPAHEARSRIKIHEPDNFTGDRTKYRTWRSQMERYLASHPNATQHELITVVMSFIRGPTIDEWVNAYADQHFDGNARTWGKTLGEVWADLDLAYTDRIGEHSALQRMRDLRQREGHAAEYFQEYEKLMWMAGMDEDDRMTLEYVKDALCSRFRQSIHSMVNMPTTYQQWKETVRQLDDNYMREQAIIQGNRARSPPTNTHNPHGRNTNNARTPTFQNPIAGAPRADGTGITFGGQGQPMDIDRTRTGQCWRCGGRRGQPAPGCQNQWHRAPAAYQRAPTPAPPAPPVNAPAQRFRGMTTEELTALVRELAERAPDELRQAGFGEGPA